MQEIVLGLICFAAVVGIPTTAVVIIRETRRTFDIFTRHLENQPRVVGGETEEIARARIDLDAARLDLQRDEIEAKRTAIELDHKVRAARLGLVAPAVDRIESA